MQVKLAEDMGVMPLLLSRQLLLSQQQLLDAFISWLLIKRWYHLWVS